MYSGVPVHLVVLTFFISRFVAHEREVMNVFITLVLGASSLAVAFGDPRVMIESTYTETKGLNDLAKTAWQNRGGKYMGTATDIKQLGDPYYIQKLNSTSDFGMITPSNAMKWDATEPKQGNFTFEDADKIVAFANKTGARIRCHTLVWHKQVPEWVQVLEKAELLEAMSNHITKVMTHFGNSCTAWDVVNEAFNEDGSYRQSFWYKKTGKEYISTAFKTANEVKAKLSLQARLYYNDFNINIVNNKSDAVLGMATDLRSHKIWVEGIGFQSHYSNNDTVAGAKIFENFRRFTVKHMDVAITELDVKTSMANPTVSEQQQQVGIITNVVSACKKTVRCVGVTVWDFVDTYSWIKSSAPLLFYQPDGPSTPLVRKATYDAITAGWILQSMTTPRVVQTRDGIDVSSLDERQFKYLTLPNALHALVVSDPSTETASAAMDVRVGFHSDPDDIPGLAHFCEHMLFMGTAKYPDENSYSVFLNAHGGSSNAFTSGRDTNYYFDHPQLIRDDDICRVWYKPDVKFKKPRTFAVATFHSPEVNPTPYNYALSALFVACLKDELNEYSYDALLAGMNYKLRLNGSNIYLSTGGYSSKLPILVQRILEVMGNFGNHIGDEAFERVKRAKCRSFENMRLEEAHRHAVQQESNLLHERSWSVDDIVNAIGTCSYYDVIAHSKRLFRQVFCDILLYGNLNLSEAMDLAGVIVDQVRAPRALSMPSSKKYWIGRQVKLSSGVHTIYKRVHPNPDNANCAVNCIYQIGVENCMDRAKLALFSQIVDEPLFDQLRTKEQLGYTVYSTPCRGNGVQSFKIVVQSNVASPEFIEQRIDTFWRDFREMLTSMSSGELQKHIQSVVKGYVERPKSQEEEVQALLVEIANHQYEFGRKTKLADLVRTLQLSDVLEFFDNFIRPEGLKHKKLSVHIYGNETRLEMLAGCSEAGWCTFNSDNQVGIMAALTLGACSGSSSSVKTEYINDSEDYKRRAPRYEAPVASIKELP
ncbi:hypothetical protein AM588_10001665 [Phytophthora nicotianae]|uniref:GH10 domain-containing protein n=1 Tax=Phytophthora nicotianae TaxID=4792 RepID=A0A0W8CV26_PHYNI|nr:hypothetical protein AM588_10001665 [Phytophthora nicotianae]